jgi:hypothetical protein
VRMEKRERTETGAETDPAAPSPARELVEGGRERPRVGGDAE